MRAVREREGRFIRLRSRFGPQALVGGMHPLRDFGRMRIELVHRAPDDRGPRPLEERFPCLVDAEVAPVDALEEHRIGQRFDEQLGLPLCLGELGLALAEVFGDFPGDAVRAMRRGGQRADQPGEQHADGEAAGEGHPRHQGVACGAETLERRTELELPGAPADRQRSRDLERVRCRRQRGALVEQLAGIEHPQL